MNIQYAAESLRKNDTNIISYRSNAPERLGYVDVCKAIGIILVILGHTYDLPMWIYCLIYSFHMPLFFILTGYTFNREKNLSINLSKFTLNKAKQYLLPYFLFAFINLAIQILWRLILSKQEVNFAYLRWNVRGILLCYSHTDYMPNCSPLWFLMCLFIASVLFWIILRGHKKWAWVAVLACVITNYLTNTYSRGYTSVPFKLPTALMAVLFLYVGYYLRKIMQTPWLNKTKHSLLQIFIVLALVIGCFIIIISTDNNVGMNENTYGNYIIFVVTATIVSACLLFLSKRITFLNNRFLLWLGKHTLYIVAFNYICRDIATELYYLTPVLRDFPMHWFVNFLYTFGVCVSFSFVISKIKKIFKQMHNRTANT